MKIRLLLTALSFVVAMAVTGPAQDPGGNPFRAGADWPKSQENEVKEGAELKIRGFDQAKQPAWATLNYKLHVKLTNGRTIVGIARNGRLFETIVLQGKVTDFEKSLKRRYGINPSTPLSQRIIPAAPTDPNVGVRLWHHDQTGGYIFVLYRDIAWVKPLKVISPAELKELDELARRRMAARKDEIQKKWKEYQERKRAAAKQRLEEQKKSGPKADQKPKSAGGSDLDTEALDKLFQRFHPSKGWTPGRKKVIEWRKWTLGIFPTDEEKEFLARYGDWKKAYDKWMSEYAEEGSGNGAKSAPAQKDKVTPGR